MSAAESEPGELTLGMASASAELDPISQSYQSIRDKITERFDVHAALGRWSQAVVEIGQQYNDFIITHLYDHSELSQKHREQLSAAVTTANQAYHDCIARSVELDKELLWLPAPLAYNQETAKSFGLAGLLLSQEEIRQSGFADGRPTYATRYPGQVDTHAVGRLLTDTVPAHSAFGNQQEFRASESLRELRENGRDVWTGHPTVVGPVAATFTEGEVVFLQHDV